MSKLEEILAEARKRKVKVAEAERQRRMLEMRAVLDDLRRKKQAADVQDATYTKERLEKQKLLGELRSLKEFVPESDFEEQETQLLSDLNDLEEKLQAHKSLLDALSNQLSSSTVALSNFSSTKPVSALSENESAPLIASYERSRDAVKQAYDEIKGLKALLMSTNDQKVINCHCRIAAGNLRVLQEELDPAASSSEQIVFRCAFGTVGALAKEFSCGIVTALFRDRRENWRQYVNQARLERDKILSSTQLVKKVTDSSAEKREDEGPRLVEVTEGVKARVRGKKIVFFGGDKEVPLLMQFAENELEARRVAWYCSKKNDYDSIVTSISARGPDVVVMLNMWSSHKFSSPVIAACKKAGIPFIELLSSSREALRDQLGTLPN